MNRRARAIGSIFAVLFCLSACGTGEDRNCGPEDQRDSYMAPLVVDQTTRVGIDPAFQNLGPRAVEAIEGAIQSWNQFSDQELGYSLFKPIHHPEIRSELRTVAGEEFCQSASVYPEQFVILLEQNDKRWKEAQLTSLTPAITFRCTLGNRLAKQVVLIHEEYADSRQYQSLALHELGHAAGLNHSCNDRGDSSRFRSCRGLSEEHPYFSAVMYPVFRVGYSPGAITDIKHTLRPNDRARTQCLYRGR